MFQSILIVWLVAFGSVALTTYGKLEAKLLAPRPHRLRR